MPKPRNHTKCGQAVIWYAQKMARVIPNAGKVEFGMPGKWPTAYQMVENKHLVCPKWSAESYQMLKMGHLWGLMR